MADIFSKRKRSEVMSLIRSKNTKPELALRKLVSGATYPMGYRYRLHYRKAYGRPDIAFVSRKTAIFVDGAFWHGYDFKNARKKLPPGFWRRKIGRNVQRDREVNRRLKKAGWRVVRVWDHVLKKDPEGVIRRVLDALKAA